MLKDLEALSFEGRRTYIHKLGWPNTQEIEEVWGLFSVHLSGKSSHGLSWVKAGLARTKEFTQSKRAKPPNNYCVTSKFAEFLWVNSLVHAGPAKV